MCFRHPKNHINFDYCGFLLDIWSWVVYPGDMLTGIRIFASDPTWRQILGDLNATVLSAPSITDVNMDDLHICDVVTPIQLKAILLSALDNRTILREIFGRDVSLPHLQSQIVVLLHKTGGMTSDALKIALGYAPDATTHTVDTAIYQLRRTYGHEFIKNSNGVYSLGRI